MQAQLDTEAEAEVKTEAEAEIEIELNGQPHRLPAGLRVQDLIDTLALSGQALALAVNRQVLPRQQWAVTALAAHDKVDIVRAIGGG